MNRSEELCKLLGIEPNWVNITCKGLECKNKCNLFVLPSDKCRKIEKGEPCQHIYRYKEIYPDLTKPSNFVKLLECVSDHLTPYGGVEIDTKGTDYIISIRDMCEDIRAKTFQDGLIICVIEILNNNELWSDWWDCDEIGDDIRINFISQAQQTEWEY